MNINPQLSDMESEEEYGGVLNQKGKEDSKDEYEIDYDGIDTLNGSHEDGDTIQSDRFLKMSHISTKKSNSTSSNIQDCQDLVNGLENGSSSMNIDDSRKFGIFETQKSENHGRQPLKEGLFMPSFDLNSKNQPAQKEEIKIIKSKIMPEESSSQMQICELITDSIELGQKEAEEAKMMTCMGLSGETTQITRIRSESQKSGGSQVEKMLEIDIAKNYSFTHESEALVEGKEGFLKENVGGCLSLDKGKNESLSKMSESCELKEEITFGNSRNVQKMEYFIFPDKNLENSKKINQNTILKNKEKITETKADKPKNQNTD